MSVPVVMIYLRLGEPPPDDEGDGSIIERPLQLAAYGRKAMDWFSRKTSIAGIQISNSILVLAAVVVVLIIYTFNTH